MSAATLVVAGLGRCGTSMVMQMLSRGGMPCVGAWPAFEPAEAQTPTASFIALCAGSAVKVLDPQRVGLPGDVRVIWLDRNHGEQAKSIAKLAQTLLGVHVDREGIRKLARSMLRDTREAMAVIGSRPLVRLQFEDVLADPHGTALVLESFALHPGFDANSAASAVRLRSPKCADGLDMELALIREGA